ncbi:putative bifunctional diguanylate cyclase/phosphodiesterase [Pengzhenrongella sicca]|uniref:EAL domain-containing protein n=1 Tax=Pengzhenrongella sicca TaxID=2819238 RepID=A0A8A4Z9U6_9MICO|nr:EAL domain-containing protein [Pengzhenrongella sicca]QTE27809.1 EAL domain-containing protein [Pengzhenrongella sicca]
MENSVAGWAAVAQCVTAGYISALCYQHWADWRTDRRTVSAAWLMAWTAALAVLFLLNGAVAAMPAGRGLEIAQFGRSAALTATLLLALPAIKVFAGGRPIRWYVVLTSVLVAARIALWLATDLAYAREVAGGLSSYGVLVVLSIVAPLAVVIWYAVTSIMRMPASRVRLAAQAAGVASVGALLGALLLPPGPAVELLASVWAIPLVVLLQAMRVIRGRVAEKQARRQHGMRDALASIGNDSWFAREPRSLLALAQTAAREQLDDPSIVGTMRALSRGRFSTDFHSVAGLEPDPLARGFLDDLRRLVSVTAERVQLADELREAAFTDSLTLVPNRRALERHLAQAVARAGQNGTRLGVLYCDIDGFKVGNDQHGHAWGDYLLRRTARHLQANVASTDVVARFGGDEFVVVIEGEISGGDLVELAKRIHTGGDLDAPDEVALSLSVGIALWAPGGTTDPEQLLREADTAMFEAKRRPGGVVVFDDALRTRMLTEQSLRRDLDLALERDELVLHFQPIVDAATLEVVSVEALVRWQHPDGVRMPAQWIAFAEETGLIVPIGRRLVTLARAGAERLGLPVAVNVAARQLAEPLFLEHLRLDWGDDNWHLLTLEITESALLEDLTHVIAALTSVRALGARVSIDDFGTGYSSFARLATLPVDVLKIDQAFVHDLDLPGGVAVVRAIVTLAQAYGLDVIAEGVERSDQLDTLAALGVPKLQGYLLGRPSAQAPRRVDLAGDVVTGPIRRADSV